MLTATQTMQDLGTTGVAPRAAARIECARTRGVDTFGVTANAYQGRTLVPSIDTGWFAITAKSMSVPAFHNPRPLRSP